VEPMNLSIEIAAGDEIMIEIIRKFVLADLHRFFERFRLDTVATYR
jgi:uncharacterized SAM-dependent methyltransferase